MSKAWRGDDWPDDDMSSEPQWSEDLSFGDPDAWRGADPETAGASWADEQTSAIDGWPEWDAGPEYRMWKRLADGER